MNGSMDDAGGESAVPERLRGIPSRLLTHSAMHADRLLTERLRSVDARKWHYAVLVTLELGPTSQATLSRRTGIYRSDMVAVINELAERGHVDRTPDPTDRRRNIITMTPQGRRHLRRLAKAITATQDELMEPLTQPERKELTRLLKILMDHHAAKGGPTWGPTDKR